MSITIIVIAVIIAALLVIREICLGGRRTNDDWPLVARPLLSERETELYRRLESLYPEHRIFVQVALSQLLDVVTGTDNPRSIRNRFQQLVADFVLCRRDLAVVAVIELDDSSHSARHRQNADRRKTKALESAGLRLVRIPAGPIPAGAELRRMIRAEQLELCRDAPIAGDTPARARGEIVKMLRPVLGPTLIAIAVVGGWFVYSGILAGALPKVAVPARVPTTPTIVPAPVPVSTPLISATAGQGEEQPQGQADHAHAVQLAADALAKRKAAAWAAYYKAPASCEHPPAWADQVECGNQYIRAKNEFEKKWQAEADIAGATGGSGSTAATGH